MVSNKKIDRAMNGPGFFEITLGVALSIALGVLLSAVYLVFKPVEKVVPETPDKATVYYVEGSTNSSKSRQWMRKRQMLAEGSAVDVVLVEEELNAWVSASVAPEKNAQVETVTPEKVNFRLRDGVMQIGVLSKVAAAGFERELVVQSRGTFVPGHAGFVFTADELYIGSLPTHTVPGLKDFIIRRVLANQPIPEDLLAAWAKFKTVAVEGNTLHLALP